MSAAKHRRRRLTLPEVGMVDVIVDNGHGHRSAAVQCMVHHKVPVLGLHVRGQVVQTWLISPETLVGHLLSRRALAIRALSHLLRTGHTRLGRRHPRWLLRGLAECVHCARSSMQTVRTVCV